MASSVWPKSVRRPCVWITGFLLTGLFLVAAARPEDPLEKAKRLIEMKQYDMAIETLAVFLVTDPTNATALEMKQKATSLNEKAGRQSEIHRLLVEANTYLDAEQRRKAMMKLNRILEMDPEHDDAKRLLANLEMDSDLDLLATEEGPATVQEGDFVDQDDLDEAPRIVRRQPLIYPVLARKMRIEGRALLLLTIGIDGKVEKVQFLQRIEHHAAMNRSAEKAAKHYRFTPAMKDGVKVKTVITMWVDFRL